jgi:hypothetical protein
MENKQAPNEPEHVRLKRSNRAIFSSDSSETSESTDTDEAIPIEPNSENQSLENEQVSNTLLNIENDSNPKMIKRTRNRTSRSLKKSMRNNKPHETKVDIIQPDHITEYEPILKLSDELESGQPKQSQSFYSIQNHDGQVDQAFNDASIEVASSYLMSYDVQKKQFSIADFVARIPKWGAVIQLAEFKNVEVTNTCTVDYFLLSIWVVNKIVPACIASFPNIEVAEPVKKIIDFIEKNDWNMVRQIWISEVMKKTFSKSRKVPKLSTISLFGTVHDRFIKYLMEFQTYHLLYSCSLACPNTNRRTPIADRMLMFCKRNDKVELDTGRIKYCNRCKQKIIVDYELIYHPTILMIESGSTRLGLQDIPLKLKLRNYQFRLLCSMLHTPGHFLGVFLINDDQYVVDDMKKDELYLPPLPLLQRRDPTMKYYNLDSTASFYFLENINV